MRTGFFMDIPEQFKERILKEPLLFREVAEHADGSKTERKVVEAVLALRYGDSVPEIMAFCGYVHSKFKNDTPEEFTAHLKELLDSESA